MVLENLPVQHPDPDGERFIGILEGSVRGARTPLVEYLVDEVVMGPKQAPMPKNRSRAALTGTISFLSMLSWALAMATG